MVHADITQFTTTDSTKAFIYFIQDNYSRAILKYKVAADKKAHHTIELLQSIYAEHPSAGSSELKIVTDDGSENKTIKSFFEGSMPSLQHLIAQKDICFSNSMIEYLNRTIKYRYLYQQPVKDMMDLQKVLAQAVDDYNNRPAHILMGRTPLETLKGITIDTEQIEINIRLAAINRIAINKQHICCF